MLKSALNSVDLFVTLLTTGALFLVYTQKNGLALKLLTPFVVFAFLLHSPFLRWSVTFLENRFPVPPVETLKNANMKGILFLGGTWDIEKTKSKHRLVYNHAASRIISLIQLANDYPKIKIFLIGGGYGQVNEAHMVKNILMKSGIDEKRILIEDQSKNTVQNAAFSYKKIHPESHEKWVLLTSAAHIPRAVGLFRKTGWDVIPYPVDFHTSRYYTLDINSWETGLFSFRKACVEWIGLVLNYVYGHSDKILPDKI